jgi:hypothetical protein
MTVDRRVEAPPVHLATLPRSLLPPWPQPGVDAALAWLAAREPRLSLHDRCDDALAERAASGERIICRLPRGSDLRPLRPLLERIGRRQIALKLVIEAADLPWPPAEHGLAAWWVAEAGSEQDAVLAWALAGEEPVLLALAQGNPPWPAEDAWEPGAARCLADGAAGTILCTAADAHAALAGRGQLGVLQLTGLIPAPVPALLAAAERGPLLAWGEDLARHLAPLAALDPRLRARLAGPAAGPAGDPA